MQFYIKEQSIFKICGTFLPFFVVRVTTTSLDHRYGDHSPLLVGSFLYWSSIYIPQIKPSDRRKYHIMLQSSLLIRLYGDVTYSCHEASSMPPALTDFDASIMKNGLSSSSGDLHHYVITTDRFPSI